MGFFSGSKNEQIFKFTTFLFRMLVDVRTMLIVVTVLGGFPSHGVTGS